MDQFNELGEAVAYAHTLSPETKEVVSQLKEQIAATNDRNAQTVARERLNRLEPKTVAKQLGLFQEPQLLKNIALLVKMSNPDAFEISIVQQAESTVAFRGVLDRRWLRTEPQMLRSLYGTSIEAPVTMVGYVTHLPKLTPPAASPSVLPVRASSDERPSMRDSFRQMFRAGRFIDQMTLESDSRVEVVICPIAVYREKEVALVS